MTQKEAEERNRNFEWLMSQNLSEYEGCWVSVVDREVVAKGKSLGRVVAKSRDEHPDKNPFVMRVTAPGTLAV